MTVAAPNRHVIVIHRWRDGGGLYERYLDHLTTDVSYLVTPAAAPSVPRTAGAIEVVSRTDDLMELATAAARLHRRFGPPNRVVALADADADTAAELRVLFGCAGELPPDRTLLRDRHAMLTALAAAGVRVGEFALVTDGEHLLRLLAELGPVTMLPRFGTGAGMLVRTAADADRLGLLADPMSAEPMLARRYRPAPRYRLDGIWDGGRLLSWRASRYLGPDAAPTGPAGLDWIGAVELDAAGTDGSGRAAALAELAGTVLGRLVGRPSVVHLTATGAAQAGEAELSFEAVSTGLTGIDLPLLWQEVHGIDLAAAAIAGQLGQPLPQLPPPDGSGQVGGWLQVRLPVTPPCLVEAVELAPGDPAPYASRLPRVGERIPAGDPVIAGLRFRASGSASVERAIRAAAARLRLRCTPL